MKNYYLILLLFIVFFNSNTGFCTQHTISAGSTDFVYTPSAVNAVIGDTIVFNLAIIHSVLEVSDTAWAANHKTALPGGFHIGFGGAGGNTTVVTQARIYYFVCENHYFMGMKGTITVTATGVKSVNENLNSLIVYPNPAAKGVTIKSNVPEGKNQLKIFAMDGKCIFQKSNVAPVQYLDLSTIAPGTYLLEIRAEGLVFEQKIALMRE